MREDDQGRRLCTATTRKGEPCRGAAITGGLVCRMHGGDAPQVKAAADRVTLEELVGPALARLKDLVEDKHLIPQVQLGSVKLILELTGFKPATQLDLTIPPLAVINDWVEQLTAQEQ